MSVTLSVKNNMGKILMMCKIALQNNTVPPIDYELLRAKKIYLFGKLLTFDGEGQTMKIETFKINTLYRGIALEGICRIIPYSTYSITMEKPCKGLSKSAYFRNGFTMENIMGRAEFELGRLYEQYQNILYDYDRYKKLWTEWKQYNSQLQASIEESIALKEEADAETLAFLDFHIGMLKRDGIERFYELIEKYDIKPLSLSPSVLETSIRLIDEEFNHR